MSTEIVQTLKSILFSGQRSTVFAILDGASVSDLPANLASFGPEHICLFRGELEPDMAEVAPYLVILEYNAPFTEWVLSNGWGKHWGIFGIAQGDLPILRKHFRNFLTVSDDTGRALSFRYYDPRVWRYYLPECNSDELNTVFGPVTSYLVEDENPKVAKRFEVSGKTLHEERLEIEPFQKLLSSKMYATALNEKPSSELGKGFIWMSAAKLEAMDKFHLYSKLHEFVATRCKKESLLTWSEDSERKRLLWDPMWSSVRALSEHDCALALIYMAVCDCEGIDLDARVEWLEDLSAQEIEIKRFLSDRGYFRFSDFDYREG